MPRVTIFRNPPRDRKKAGGVLSKRAIEIRYIHAEDGKAYRHPFRAGVTIEFLPDGSARLFRPDGLPVWKDF